MTLLALDTTPVSNVVAFPAQPKAPTVLKPRDIVRLDSAHRTQHGRRAIVVSVKETPFGQRCKVLFVEGKKGDPWRGRYCSAECVLIKRPDPLPRRLPPRMSTKHPDHSGPAA